MTFFDSARFEQLRTERQVTWGRPVRAHETCVSTNDLALDAIKSDAKTGIVFLAREQTSGRGRRGSRWSASPGECLMCSVLLRYPPHAPSPHGLSLAVGLAVAGMTLERVPPHRQVRLKWPNDVYVDDRKVAGILIESKVDATGQLGLVIGIGLNVSTSVFPPQLAHATSLKLLGAPEESWESLLVDLLKHLEKQVSQWVTSGLSTLSRQVAALDYLFGKSFLIDGQPAVGRGIDEQGHLLVELQSGERKTYSSAHIELT
jgi:BirA family biotin operon repressor/biotin-[acetyl-CoA-carboxylase] ligase